MKWKKSIYTRVGEQLIKQDGALKRQRGRAQDVEF